jgi:hypothetical protein
MRGFVRYGLVLIAVFFLAGLGPAPAGADSPGEFEAWSAIERAPTDAGLADFLTKYPQSPFRQKAAAKLAELRGTSPADVLDQFPGSKVPQSAAAGPAPASKPEPPKLVGTFSRSDREYYDDKSGFFEWEDTLVLNADGTADLTTKYTVSLRPFYYLRGCDTGSTYVSAPRVGTYRWTRKYTVTVAATTLSLQPEGPAEVSWVDPSCWEPGAGTGEDKAWVLDLVDGRLSDADGDFARKF